MMILTAGESMRSISEYLSQLTIAAEPLARHEKVLVAFIFAIVAISRFLALSTSQLDWDESLFSCAVREYDVVPHHPHPPGYPLFILAAKFMRLFTGDDFRSLQAVATTASILLFPAAFLLARELRLRFRVALITATLTAFLPTVWYYGGTGLSDIPALCAVVAAAALLLAGGRNPRAWIAGMFVLGLAAGIRPQHVLIGAVPALLGASAGRQRRMIIIGCALFAVVVVASYTGAAFASARPPFGYLEQAGVIAQHVGSTDSFANQGRPPLRDLAGMFFVRSHRGGTAGEVLLTLAVLAAIEALIRRRVAIWVVLAMFVPTAIMSWMMFDTTAVARYGLGYVMLFSFLGACGIDVVARLRETEFAENAVAASAGVLLVFVLIVWTWPALQVVRRHASPPAAAMQWIRTHVPKAGPQLYIDDSLGYHSAYQLAGYSTRFFSKYAQIPDAAYAPGNYCIIDRVTVQPHARLYRFERGRLADIARRSYFDVSVIPMNAMIRFGMGWHQEEFDASDAWRWMGRTSSTLFPPLPADSVLRLRFRVPLDTLPHPPAMTVTWNGAVIDRYVCSAPEIERRYVLHSLARPNELRIQLDSAAHPIERGITNDAREFGLQLLAVTWERTDGVPYGT